MSNTPSDADIEALAQQHLKAFAQFTGAGEVWFEGEVEFARAVLAKWGTPPPARKPLTNEQRMEVFNEAMKRCDENLNLPWRVAILEQVEIAHGITKGGQHGTDN